MPISQSFLIIAIFFVVAILLPVAALTMARLLRASRPTEQKATTYESGADPVGGSWVQFHVRYYLYALLFVIFDVEAIYLFPWAASYDVLRSEVGLAILLEMGLFIGFLILGLIYAWKKKVLEWK
ncbi:NADH-quinone oxidoreductase subunit A [Shimazuella kribbensis]|uniref:NADH-quinone oxidoreductase subunit A n=1 Tax=Shimazuella kribbensis TaxID=139808 RepID=UPI00042532AF|nr:NADH-quinone oxidoreductase subunit A [Shimazuella kribbensis]